MADDGLEEAAGLAPLIVARTRLVPPRLREETVDRPALVALRMGSSARLGVVTGPAGSGKSTLLAQCHAVEPFPAWLSLDGDDNDPVELWWSVIEALRTVVSSFGKAYRDRLISGGVAAVDGIVASVCNELAARGVPIHLFLDDLHVVENEHARRSLHRFVSLVPQGVRVTVASRYASPIPLARLRALGELLEIGPTDLALTRGESNQLLKSFGAQLDQAHLDLLVDRTEGWAAGLQLAGLAAAQSQDCLSFVEGFSGTDRDVADYLVSEALESVSDEEREFMIETSILSRFDGDLCDAVTGRAGGADILLDLERVNAFLIPLDREDRWFRYHHLFGELVTAELHRTRPEAEVALHRRAFEWLREHGEVADAVRHGLAAGEVQAAADLLCSSWMSMMGGGRSETARLLIASFPEDVAADHQPFAVAGAGVSAMTGQTEAAQRWLEAAETGTYDGPRPDGMASTASSVGLIRGTLAPEGVDAALADGRTALELEPADSPHRPLAAFLVGRSLVMRGDVDQAIEFLEEAGRTGGTNERAYALAELSLVQLGSGDAEQALTTAEASRTLMHETGGDSLFITATAHGAKALAAIHLGDERAARADLRAAREPMAAAHAALPMDATRTRLILARAAIELDEAGIALGYLREAEGVIRSVTDVGVMRQEHADLMVRVDALEPRADGGADDEFTERELQVLAVLPTPLTVREIAEELFVSRNTIKTHTRRLYRKLNAASRDEAVLIAADRGLLQAGDDAPAS